MYFSHSRKEMAERKKVHPESYVGKFWIVGRQVNYLFRTISLST